MDTELLPTTAIISLSTVGGALTLPPHVLSQLPVMIIDAGDKAAFHFVEFFTANIGNPNTRRAYARAVGDFTRWAEQHRVTLWEITSITVAAYIEGQTGSPQGVQQKRAAIRILFDHLVGKQVIPENPAAAVRGPKYVIKKGKTPALSTQDTRRLLDSFGKSDVTGLRDRVAAAGIAQERKSALFRTVQGRPGRLTTNRIRANDVLRMDKRRAEAIGLPYSTCCHTFRATGITAHLENGGTLEHAQQIAAHESPPTTNLYDRTNDQITLDEIERVVI